MSGLFWPPIHAVLDERARAGDALDWVVVPYVKVGALERVFERAPPKSGFKLVCRWLPADLVVGVSDLEVYGYLRDKGCQLFVNQRIHMKLYVFESNAALATSGNLTMRGLGYADAQQSNVEVGMMAELSASDWVQLYRVVGESRLVTPELYARFEDYVRTHPAPPAPDPPPDLLGPPKTYTLASLPATETPELLADFYFSPTPLSNPPDFVRRAYHDLALFGIPSGLSKESFDKALTVAFRASPFVVSFLDYLRGAGSLRFGSVNGWIHDQCEDVPLPYRWEIKPSTHILYEWMAHFFSEVTWDRPSFSQVIYWNRR